MTSDHYKYIRLQQAVMNNQNHITENLIAPCGMNCALCSRYMVHKFGLKKSSCRGCIPENRECGYLFKRCRGINKPSKENAVFCFDCGEYPCKDINRMDKRYSQFYRMSVKDNLEFIKEKGIKEFIKDQYEKHKCSRCGGLISVHNGRCFNCDEIRSLIDKEKKQGYTL